jgi:hypothetical protein
MPLRFRRDDSIVRAARRRAKQPRAGEDAQASGSMGADDSCGGALDRDPDSRCAGASERDRAIFSASASTSSGDMDLTPLHHAKTFFSGMASMRPDFVLTGVTRTIGLDAVSTLMQKPSAATSQTVDSLLLVTDISAGKSSVCCARRRLMLPITSPSSLRLALDEGFRLDPVAT